VCRSPLTPVDLALLLLRTAPKLTALKLDGLGRAARVKSHWAKLKMEMPLHDVVAFEVTQERGYLARGGL
jgi:hypothetical protein